MGMFNRIMNGLVLIKILPALMEIYPLLICLHEGLSLEHLSNFSAQRKWMVSPSFGIEYTLFQKCPDLNVRAFQALEKLDM